MAPLTDDELDQWLDQADKDLRRKLDAVDIQAVMADDQLINAIRLPSPQRSIELARIDREAGWTAPADVELRQLLGGWRDGIHARRLPPWNLDAGRVAHQLSQARRHRTPVVLWWVLALMVACWVSAAGALWVLP